LPLFGLLQAVGIASWALAPRHPSYSSLAALTALEHLTSGMATAALFTASMERCRPQHAATDYTLQASLIVLGTGVAAALSGFPAQALGYPAHFALCAALTLLPAALAFFQAKKA
jgi:predicted MFS family arabinose efflux permease